MQPLPLEALLTLREAKTLARIQRLQGSRPRRDWRPRTLARLEAWGYIRLDASGDGGPALADLGEAYLAWYQTGPDEFARCA